MKPYHFRQFKLYGFRYGCSWNPSLRAVAGKTHKRANSQLAEAAQSRSSRATPTKACRRKQPSPVAIEDEEAHSEEAASAANEAQFPTDTDDTTEDEATG